MKQIPHTLNGQTHSNLRLGEHEILLSFVNDSGAEAFFAYWQKQGHADFVEWCENSEYEFYRDQVEVI